MPKPPPFSRQFPRVDAGRVKSLLSSDAYKPIVALLTLKQQLGGREEELKLLDAFWGITMKAAQEYTLAAGYTHGELTAALSVSTGGVAPPA
jgi:hypothetical protein